jgi:plastocyanin
MRSSLTWLLMITAAAAAACSDSDTGPDDDGDGTVGTVTVGNIFFRSDHNSTQNPAVDTVAAGTTVTWTWSGTGTTPHSVRSEGSPSFTSSTELTGEGQTYSFTFATPGTYTYDCVVHGDDMTGRLVVQ